MKKALLALASASLFAVSAQAADYKIDPSHSEVGFKVRHLAISNVSGAFSSFTGTFSYDPKNVKAASAVAEITVKSINTNDTKRDDHLRAPDFFETERFPTMKFVSKSAESTGENTFKVNGDLTIKGVTKPVVLDVTYEGAAKDPWGKEKAGFTATTKIDRKEFGLTWSKVLETGGLVVGDDVTITLQVEGEKVVAG
jgi:polyisoprenoid-binding protein YceI